MGAPDLPELDITAHLAAMSGLPLPEAPVTVAKGARGNDCPWLQNVPVQCPVHLLFAMKQKNTRTLKMKTKVVLQSAGAGAYYPKAEVWCVSMSIC